NLINQPIRRFNRLLHIIQMAIASADRIFEILDTEPEVIDQPDATTLTTCKGALRFESVTFGYNAQQPVLRDFNLQIEPGMTVALVGSSGAGKSTIAKLAARFYDPQNGSVYIDDQDLRSVALGSLRQQLGIVSQDTLLLYGTIRENIAYGKLDATTAEIEAAAKAANAHEFIQAFPEGYDSIVGERGVRLSGGQRQRLAIARVLIRNPRIVLLDEATSALDTESEALIQSSLNELMHDRTSLVIAHRLSTIQHADLIVVLEHGQIVEQGSHQELLAKGGRYSHLHALQFPQQRLPIFASPADTPPATSGSTATLQPVLVAKAAS
ncbi:MAG: ATP-binding cassette domain-containing protein, partial [Cyanobacteria bacterium P01_H01_bin.121]